MHQATQHTKEKKTKLWRILMGMTALCMGAVTVLAAFAGGGENDSAQAAPLRTGRIVLYAQDAPGFSISKKEASAVDQLNYAFALIRNGEASVSHMKGLQGIKRVMQQYPELEVLLSIGGWGADGFSQACATPEGRKKLVDSILRIVDEYGFQGVDVDWEYPANATAGIASAENDMENWYALLKLLREGLDERAEREGRMYRLSVALGAGEEHIAKVDGVRLNALVDQAVVMAYDLRGFDKTTGHHAGLYPDGKTKLSAAWAVQAYKQAGLKNEKILLGMPLYGRMWRQVPENGGLNQRAGTSGNRVLTQLEVTQRMQSGAYTRHWDDDAKAPYLIGEGNFISFDDAQSAAEKAAYLTKHELQGVALWAKHQDEDGSLLQDVSLALTAP